MIVPDVNVEDIMSKELVMVDPDTTVAEALKIMLEKGIRSVVVKPTDERDVYSVVTIRDVVYRVIARNLDPREVTVWKIATRPAIMIQKGTRLSIAIEFMRKFNLARVIVADGSRPIGMLALMDIIRAVKEKIEKEE